MRLRMHTCRANLWSFLTHGDITAVSALPYHLSFFGKHSHVFNIVHKRQVSLFVRLLGNGYVAIHGGNCLKTFLLSHIGKVRIIYRPLFMFARSGSTEILERGADYTCRIAGSNFYHASFEKLEHTFGMFFLLIGRFGENSRDLFVTLFFRYARKVSVAHSCL